MADNNTTKKISPVAVGVAGAIAGAAIGAVAAKALSNEKNRKMIKKKMGDFKQWSEKTLTELRKKGDEVRDDIEEAVEKVKDKGESSQNLN